MKLTIDTESDTKDDLRKVIRFLRLLVDERDFRMAEEPNQAVNMGNFFDSIGGSTEPAVQREEPKEEKEPFKLDFF